jgi:DHA2 family methylenomycin A resistance protein-like MFS transporter
MTYESPGKRSEDVAVGGRRALLVVMCVGMFLVLLDVTAVNVALPSIARSLGAAVPALQWVVDGYAVTIASLLLMGGTVGDRLGHRRVLLIGFALFGIASIVIGGAPDTGVVIGGRIAQGAGAALLLPGTLAVITHAFPERKEQARAIGTWAAISSLALPAGPLLGGALTMISWRMIFLINVPLVLLAVGGVLRLVPRTAGQTRKLDPAGMAGVTIALAATVFAVIEYGRSGFGPLLIGAAALAFAAIGWTVYAEHRASTPMLPPALLRRPAFLGPNVVALTMNLIFNGTLFLTTLYLQDVRHYSPFQSGLLVLPLAVPLVALAPFTSRLTARWGPRLPVTIGAAIAAPGSALLVLVRPGGSLLALEGGLLVLGCGAGLITASVVAAAVRAVPAERAGFASGLNNAARQTGTALGVAIFGATAGAPGDTARFCRSVNHLALIGCALWILASIIAATTISRQHTRTAPETARTGSDAVSAVRR